MAYVIYNVATTAIVNARAGGSGDKYYKTAGAAKVAMARMINRGDATPETLAVADRTVYSTLIEGTVERVNIMSGKTYRESVNTPNCCSPASEAYWSM